jgi:acetyl-CoA C-acetyltransferase
LPIAEIDLIDFYSCFPIAVETYAEAIGLPPDRDLTLTGGMAFAGGPYNNYFLQSTCRAIELLRQGKGRNALLSCVSGVVTKQAFALWSVDPSPKGFVHADLTKQVAGEVRAIDVLEDFTGVARVAGYTVLHGRGQVPKGVALLDTSDGKRAMVTCADDALVAAMQETELVGRQVRVEANRLLAIL